MTPRFGTRLIIINLAIARNCSACCPIYPTPPAGCRPVSVSLLPPPLQWLRCLRLGPSLLLRGLAPRRGPAHTRACATTHSTPPRPCSTPTLRRVTSYARKRRTAPSLRSLTPIGLSKRRTLLATLRRRALNSAPPAQATAKTGTRTHALVGPPHRAPPRCRRPLDPDQAPTHHPRVPTHPLGPVRRRRRRQPR